MQLNVLVIFYFTILCRIVFCTPLPDIDIEHWSRLEDHESVETNEKELDNLYSNFKRDRLEFPAPYCLRDIGFDEEEIHNMDKKELLKLEQRCSVAAKRDFPAPFCLRELNLNDEDLKIMSKKELLKLEQRCSVAA